MLLSACTPESQPAASETAVSKDLRGKRYTEIFLIGKKSTEVYNTSGLNDSPPDKVTALDGKALAREYRVPFVFVNGPRYWVVDQITAKVGKTAKFGDLDARWVAQLKLGVDFFLRPGAREPYRVGEVARATTYVFKAGKPVYALLSPNGRLFVMQAYSHTVNDNLTLDSLAALGKQLKNLPKGWLYIAPTLDQDLFVKSTNGVAHIVQDEFQNTYQRVDSTQ